jgi:hypothetical protein
MADSGAVRQRRYKAHKRGDHRYCRHLREMPAVEMLAPADPGELDPVAELRALAGRLAAAYDTDRGFLVRQPPVGVVPAAPRAGGVRDLRRALRH